MADEIRPLRKLWGDRAVQFEANILTLIREIQTNNSHVTRDEARLAMDKVEILFAELDFLISADGSPEHRAAAESRVRHVANQATRIHAELERSKRALEAQAADLDLEERRRKIHALRAEIDEAGHNFGEAGE